MLSPSSSLPGQKSVVDWDHHLLGVLENDVLTPSTREPGILRVHLLPGVQEALGLSDADIALPSRLVASIRRDEIMLDRSSSALRAFLKA